MEVWKTIEECPKYEISTYGRIKRIGKSSFASLKHFKNSSGYAHVGLVDKENKKVIKRVHILVTKTFYGNPPSGHECNHKDGNKMNPSLDNLEWITKSENGKHAYATGLSIPIRGEKNGQSKLYEKDIQRIRFLYAKGYSYSALGRKFNVSTGTIRPLIKGVTWKHI